ncbi:prepilin-type N-terminal cleavage/methylation domain-containing protein [Deinococcus sp. HMF7620]|uniref:Prepilin-type N-terminal cleavage/methylation domain-containing protein n=1 Tax=Deinococcus arboris TaxID=2682977 RepID=A0A7C9HSY4_9DEIO|nr:prepilin-type N-terminal cleavage/methylation domain-containing protein [Deinococcus arboris]MVN88174.1 prepilin-type N-terminal cleavage/methylation domain-containing protein [Deinococcus arboris]
MARPFCTAPKRTLPSSAMSPEQRQTGFTLTELLVGMSLLAAVMTIAFSMFQSSNQLVESDTSRIMAAQNAQTALDIMTNDLRQAGENLASIRLPVSGVEFNNANQKLIVRRGIAPMSAGQVGTATDLISQRPQALSVCKAIDNRVQVIGPTPAGDTPSRCLYRGVSGAGTSGDDVQVRPWRVFFASQGNAYQAALLYRPAGNGLLAAFAPVVVQTISGVSNNTDATKRVVELVLAGNVPAGFSSTNGSQIILIDQRRYWVADNQLKLAVAGEKDADAQTVAFDIDSLTLSATVTNSSTAVNALAIDGPWNRVKTIVAALKARNPSQGKANTRTFQSTIYPRNVASESR